MALASLFAASLVLVPLALQPPDADVNAAAPASDDEYAQALTRVKRAEQMANEDPERGATQLRDALALLQSFGPALAKDPDGQDARTMAQLTLARALLAVEDAEGAREVMDEAIRTSRGDTLPTGRFGPGLVALHRERAGVLEKAGTGSIAIECKEPCRVYINERPTDPRTDKLVLGSYRVWIEARDGSETPLQTVVRLEQPDQIAALEFGTAPVTSDPGTNDAHKRDRMMPRWAEIATVVAGVAAVGVGATLWAIDGRCPDGKDPNDPMACPQVYTTRTAGIITLAVGGAVALTGSVLLTVDEVRVGQQRGQQVALTWTMRF